MKTMEQQIVNYAAYHRDPRNIATHCIGIPLIVFSLTALLSRPVFILWDAPFTLAMLLAAASACYYLWLNRVLGIFMTLILIVALIYGYGLAGCSTAVWLGVSLSGLSLGWGFQFLGHHWEGRKPAFVDDIMSLMIGPLFILVEACFALGTWQQLKQQVEARVGKVRRQTIN